jgi:hypothetical protein
LRRSSTNRQARQLTEHLAVDRGLVVELELRKRLTKRVVRESEPAVEPARPGCLGLLGEQLLEHLDGRQLLLCRPIKSRRQFLGGGGKSGG